MFTSNATDVVLHAFDWPYALVTERAKAIALAGYKYVLVSPPMKSKKSDTGTQWWQRYQPQDYRVIDNQLGNTDDFKQMVMALDEHGVGVYADVVFNHMANESSIRSDLQYPSDGEIEQYKAEKDYFEKQKLFGDLDEPLFDHDDFVEAFGIKDWQDKWQVQNGRITGGPKDPGLPTLRVSDHVIEQQKSYLKALKQLGVKGFRIDAAKHMTLEHLQRVWTQELCHDLHIFGEIITNGGASKLEYDLFLEPFLANTQFGAYDFPLFQMTYDSLQPGGSLKDLVDPYCFGQALSQNRAITFAITHDIPNNEVFSELVLDEKLEWLAYSYILGRDGGVPLIYSDLDTSGITGNNGKPRWLDVWNNPKMVAAIGFHNHVHGEPMDVLEASEDLLIFARGDKGVVIINKSKRVQTAELSISGQWQDVLSGKECKGDAGKRELRIPALSSMMLLKISA
ncbi:alpha-amylase family glycosyl hydrolase [Vibrio japonicus]|uniref:Alpha-amylase n=1 Tax=Vibrio japonicus TaxID=1824638 RepID=A0ABY5LL25_9VIBR|nr:alpha-amylase family glycosyl hydrolase [Vibrio japonicus]UUM32126.1 alpha-amylase family glycosyl hydrolase [Vibrio japonicus]